jgi:hypothetical protein
MATARAVADDDALVRLEDPVAPAAFCHEDIALLWCLLQPLFTISHLWIIEPGFLYDTAVPCLVLS